MRMIQGKLRVAGLAMIAALAMRGMPLAAPPTFLSIVEPITAAEAFADPYGEALVLELASVLQKSATPTCPSRSMTAEQWRALAVDLLVRYGQRMLDQMLAMVDGGKADAEFIRLGGPEAHAELRELMINPLIAQYLAIVRLGGRDALADQITETFDRYALIGQIGVRGQVSPISTGSDLMNASRIEASEEEAEEFANQNATPHLQRYLELSDAMAAAMEAALDRDRMLRYGPLQPFDGIERELKDYCIP